MNEGMDIHTHVCYSGDMKPKVMRVSLHVGLALDAAQELERLAAESGQSQTAVLEALIRAAGTVTIGSQWPADLPVPVPGVLTTTSDGRQSASQIDTEPRTDTRTPDELAADIDVCDELEREVAAAFAGERDTRKAARKTRKRPSFPPEIDGRLSQEMAIGVLRELRKDEPEPEPIVHCDHPARERRGKKCLACGVRPWAK